MTAGGRSRIGVAAAGAALAAAAAAAYAGSFRGAFVFDDIPAIVENPTLRPPLRLFGVLFPPGDQAGTVGGRPLVNLSLALNYALGGLNPAGYHAFNLAVHVCAALLLFGIVRRTLAWPAHQGIFAACAAALLWALHPLQTEAVTYVVQRAESMMGLFYLLTLYAFIRGVHPVVPARPDDRLKSGEGASAPGTMRSAWAAVSVTACLCGMATKEVMVSAPLLVLLYDRTFVAGSFREAWRRRRAYYVCLAATWLALAALVAGTKGRGGSAGFEAAAGVWPYLLTQCRALALYLRLAAWPSPLVFDYGTALVHTPAAVAGPAIVVILLLAATAYALWRAPALGFLGAWFFALLAPTSSVMPIATEPIAEHRMYLPLAAIALAFVLAGHALHRRTHRPALWIAAGCVLALALGGTTAARNADYRSAAALWSDTAAKAPRNPRAHNDLGAAYQAAGLTARAEAEFRAAIAVDPAYAPAEYNLGVALLDAGRPADALPCLERALPAPRHQAELHLYLGQALQQTGRIPEAEAMLREAAGLAPANSEPAFELGRLLAEDRQYAAAAAAFAMAVRAAPANPRIRSNLATALLFCGRIDDAIAEYRRALELSPGDPSIRANLDLALQARRR